MLIVYWILYLTANESLDRLLDLPLRILSEYVHTWREEVDQPSVTNQFLTEAFLIDCTIYGGFNNVKQK